MSNVTAERPYNAADEKILMSELWDEQLANDLERFVMFVYPWGKEGTPLHNFKEPKAWQRDELQSITEHIKTQKEKMAMGLPPKVYKSATSSGRGIGKSTLTAWLMHWMMTTRLGSTSIITANTEDQLKNKTWGELGKWHTLSINEHWFNKFAMSLRPHAWFEKNLQKSLKLDSTYYYANAQLWSEEKPDAFAGAHNMAGELVIFDEASGIPKKIWTVTEGIFTEPILDRYWFAFSNPRRNEGEFFDTFDKYSRFWNLRNLDARTVEGVDKGTLNEIIEKYGEDSDEARVEVKGQFPRRGDDQFISKELVDQSVHRELFIDTGQALIMGCDPARFGEDTAAVRFRQGRDARSIPPIEFKGLDSQQLADKWAELIIRYDPDAVCIDAGNGAGVIDRLRHMGYKIHEIWFGSKADDSERYANKRTEMWAEMRTWLSGGSIDAHAQLIIDLAAPKYRYMGRSDKMMLEPKEEMKKRGLKSPDNADALALTFAVKVASRRLKSSRHNKRAPMAKNVDYKIFGG